MINKCIKSSRLISFRLKFTLVILAIVGFMSEANEHVFTTESQLASRYEKEIADFWPHGNFGYFSGAKNVRVNYATFSHEASPKKCLVIVPGRTESYLKYKELTFDFFNAGFNVFLIDHRGQGLSQRVLANSNKGYVEDFQYYVDDLAFFIENIVSKHCEQKPYILAHSMGAAITVRYLQAHPSTIQSAVLSSPMLGFDGGGVPKFIAESLIKTTAQLNQWIDDKPWYFFGHKDFSQNTFEQNTLMHSAIRYQQFTKLYQANKGIQLGGVTIQWLTESIAALETIFANIDKIITPILVLQSGDDKVVKNESQDEFCQQLHALQPQSCPNGKPLVIKGAYHELFFESDIYRQQALSAVLDWFNKHHVNK